MHPRFRLFAALILSASSFAATPNNGTTPKPASASTAAATSAVVFEQNVGRVDPQIKLYAYAGDSVTFFTPGRFVTSFPGGGMLVFNIENNDAAQVSGEGEMPPAVAVADSKISAQDLPGPAFARVRYTGVFPGIDLSLAGVADKLQYEFQVTKESDPSAIGLKVEGASSVSLQPDGSLLIRGNGGSIRWNRPQAYQEYLDQGLVAVDCHYTVQNGRIGFSVGKYDREALLVIRPNNGVAPYSAPRETATRKKKTPQRRG